MRRFLLALAAATIVAVLAIAYIIESARDRFRPTVAAVEPFDFLSLG